MANQRRYTIRCLLYIKHGTHKLLTVFNVLPYLISILLAPCDGTTVLYTTEDTHSLLLYHNVLPVGARSYLVLSFTFRPRYFRYSLNTTTGIAQSVQRRAEGCILQG
jgi:hypothetical protein